VLINIDISITNAFKRISNEYMSYFCSFID